MNNQQDITAVEKLIDILDSLGISYTVGGSMASSAYGVVRFTQDADIMVEPFEPLAEKFSETVKKDFYISTQAMYQALRSKSSFNVIHFSTAFKIDLFVQPQNKFHIQMLSRSRKLQLPDSTKAISFVSPEDIILLKLDWYNQSSRSSHRQWSDVMGVLAAQADSLDYDYLKIWAKELALADLLTQAITESKM